MKVILQLRLALSLIGFFVVLFLEHVKLVRTLLFSLVMLAIVVCSLAITLISLPPVEKPIPLDSVVLSTSPQKPQVFTFNQYNQQLNTYLFLNSTQPSHRDVLVNIALLYQAQNNTEKATAFWETARAVDPNNPLFD